MIFVLNVYQGPEILIEETRARIICVPLNVIVIHFIYVCRFRHLIQGRNFAPSKIEESTRGDCSEGLGAYSARN
jgi:hypothetical protein